MIYLEKHWDYFVKSFKEKKIWMTIFYEGLFLLAIFLIVVLLYSYLAGLGVKARTLTPIGLDTQVSTEADAVNFVEVVKVQMGYVLSATLAIILVALAFISARFAMYSHLTDKKRTWKFYVKNLFVSIFAGVVALFVFYLFQAVMFLIFGPNMMSQRSTHYILFFLFSLLLVFMAYLMINFKLRFFKEHAFLRGADSFFKDNIKGIKYFLIPISYSWFIFVIMNFLFFFLLFIPGKWIFLIVFTIFMILFFAWQRAYYLTILESMHKGKTPKKKTKKRTTKKG